MNKIIFLALLLVSFHVTSAIRARRRCPPVKLLNGKAKTNRRGRVIQYECNRGFSLLGESLGECLRGEWDPDPPVCLKPGCPLITNFRNGIVTESMRSALLEFSCNHGYKLVGPSFIYCNGRRWNSMQPYCKAADINCDFEGDNTCSWQVDTHEHEDYDFMWHVQQHEATSRLLGTGPKHDHTFSPNNTGHYLMIDTSDYSTTHVLPARIFSPKFPPPSNNDSCFTFWYHMFGSTVGMLNVFLNNKLVFQENNNHGDRWIMGVISLPSNVTDLQLMIEGTYGRGHTGNIGLDDFSLRNATDCLYTNVTSCEGRCGKDPLVTDSCLCTPECYVGSSCCEDYKEFCLSENTTLSSEPEDYPTDLTEIFGYSSTLEEENESFSPSSISDSNDAGNTRVTKIGRSQTTPLPTGIYSQNYTHYTSTDKQLVDHTSKDTQSLTLLGEPTKHFNPVATESNKFPMTTVKSSAAGTALTRTTLTRFTKKDRASSKPTSKTITLARSTVFDYETTPKVETLTSKSKTRKANITTFVSSGTTKPEFLITKTSTTKGDIAKSSVVYSAKSLIIETKSVKGKTTPKYTIMYSTKAQNIATKPFIAESNKTRMATTKNPTTKLYIPPKSKTFTPLTTKMLTTSQNLLTKLNTQPFTSSSTTLFTKGRSISFTPWYKVNKNSPTETIKAQAETTKTHFDTSTKPPIDIARVKTTKTPSTKLLTTSPSEKVPFLPKTSASPSILNTSGITATLLSTPPTTINIYKTTRMSIENQTLILKPASKITVSYNDLFKPKMSWQTSFYGKRTKSPNTASKIKPKVSQNTNAGISRKQTNATQPFTSRTATLLKATKSSHIFTTQATKNLAGVSDGAISPHTTVEILLHNPTSNNWEHDKLQGNSRFSTSNPANSNNLRGVIIPAVAIISILVAGAIFACFLRSRRSRLRFRNGSEGDILYVSSEEMFDFSLAVPSHR